MIVGDLSKDHILDALQPDVLADVLPSITILIGRLRARIVLSDPSLPGLNDAAAVEIRELLLALCRESPLSGTLEARKAIDEFMRFGEKVN
jgi:hypothetical protein